MWSGSYRFIFEYWINVSDICSRIPMTRKYVARAPVYHSGVPRRGVAVARAHTALVVVVLAYAIALVSLKQRMLTFDV